MPIVISFIAGKESSTRRTLHAGVNTRKGANGELFIDSIPDSAEKAIALARKIKKVSFYKSSVFSLPSYFVFSFRFRLFMTKTLETEMQRYYFHT